MHLNFSNFKALFFQELAFIKTMKFQFLFFLTFLIGITACEDPSIEDPENNTSCGLAVCLSLDSNTATANGTSIINVTAEIAANADSAQRSLTFTTTAGTFIENTTTTVTKTVEDNTVTVPLKVGIVAGQFLVKVSVGTFSAEAFIELTEIDASDALIINFTDLNTSPLRADDFSQTQIEVQAQNVDFNNKTITIEVVGGGLFTSNLTDEVTLNFDNNGKAATLLKVGQVLNDYALNFTVNEPQIKAFLILPIARANPDFINLDPADFQIDSINGSVMLTAFLGRNLGKVSNQTLVEFKATQIQNGVEVEVGNFTPPIVRSASNEQATVNFRTFSVNQVLADTTIKIISTVINDNNMPKQDSIFLKVNE